MCAAHQPGARALYAPAVSKSMRVLPDSNSWSAGHVLSFREAAYNHELRRGQRAPDALAAALAKRAYVQEVPYLVSTAALPRPLGQLEGSWGPAFHPLGKDDSVGQISSAGPSIAERLDAAAVAKRSPRLELKRMAGRLISDKRRNAQKHVLVEATQQQQALGRRARAGLKKPVAMAQQQQAAAPAAGRDISQKGNAKRSEAGEAEKQGLGNEKPASLLRKLGKAGLFAQQLPKVRCHDPRQPSTHFPGAVRAGKACSGTQGQPAEPTPAEQRPVQSLAERFADMQRTVMERLTCGVFPLPAVPYSQTTHDASCLSYSPAADEQLPPLTSVSCVTAISCSGNIRRVSERGLVTQGRVPSMAGEPSPSGRMQRATC